ncbi:MAG: DNA polymerase III subunit gamma/tau [Terracidiphilus sp.]
MGYQVLARKYRPQRFADVAGQDHVTRTLLNALSQNRIAHGYIFSGHRGIGKTTIARILAMALNCRNQVGSVERPDHEPCLKCVSCREIASGGSPEGGNEATHSFDFIEIDAASNRGIDDVRSIRNQASVQPARDRYKIFLLDEAHQITDAAFNAILKTLEEPPDWTIFMMATTEPENIPQTIRSRCQHFSFHAVKFDDILAQLKMIAEAEQVGAEDDALALLAEAGDGSMRDALSIMDQAIASAPVENGRPILAAAQIRELMGSVPNAVFERLMEAVAAGQSAELMEQLNVLLSAGHSPQALARQMVRYLRNALMTKLGGEQTELLQISADERARAARSALLFTEEELTRNLQIVLRTFDDLNYRQEQRLHLELGLLKLIHAQRLLPIEELLSGATTGARSTSAPTGATRAPAGSPRSAHAAAPAPTSSASRSISPFESSQSSWNAGPSLKQSVAAEPATAIALPTPMTEGALAKAPEAEPKSVGAPGIVALRNGVIAALANGGHASAAELLNTAAWSIEGASLHIEVPGIGKKMLSLTVNAAAEKTIRQELRRLGGPVKFSAVPGAGTASASAAAPVIAAGSIQETALAHPMVQRAREIFHAEVRSVVDLREKL